MKIITTLTFLLLVSGTCLAMDETSLYKDTGSVMLRVRTRLHQAAALGDVKLCRTLIPQYSHVDDVLDLERNTPLHTAARAGYYGVCKLLIRNGAKKSAQNMDNKTPYDLLPQEATKQLFKLLELEKIEFSDSTSS